MKHILKKFALFVLTVSIISTAIPNSMAYAADNKNNSDNIKIENINTDSGSKAELVQTSSSAVTVYNFLVRDMRLTPAAACGIMANIEHESTFNAKAKSRSGSYGLCQWTGGRLTRLKNWCKKNGFNYQTAIGQLNFLKYELSSNNYKVLYDGKTIYDHMLTIENTASGAYEAGAYWCARYEKPAAVKSRSHSRGNLSKNSYWPVYGDKTAKITSLKTNSNGIALKWKGLSKETTYDIYRSVDGKKFKKIGTSELTTYIDDNKLEDNKKYSYTIYANGFYSAVSSHTYLEGTTIKALKQSKKDSVKISWEKVPNIDGYEIQYSTSCDFSKCAPVVIDNNKKSSTVIKELKSSQTYYFRIRTYKVVSDKKYYSSYSLMQSIPITKPL